MVVWAFAKRPGLPTVSLPCGLSGNGLPLSLQLIGPHGSDRDLLSAAEWIERQLPFEHRPALSAMP